MYKTKLVATLLMFLMLAGILPFAFAKTMKRPGHYISASIGLPENLDPAWVYDSASLGLLQYLYEPLLFQKQEPGFTAPLGTVDPKTAGYVSEFEPRLAESWVIEDTIVGPSTKYTFKIRDDVLFHDPAYGTVTAEDVEWSIERAIVMDHAYGPQWMFQEPLLGVYSTTNTVAFAHAIDDSINVIHNATGDYVVFNLAMPYPVTGFLTILAQSWASIMSEAWASTMGCWPGWDDTGYDPANWYDPYHDPINSPLAVPGDEVMGSGPYMFDYWSHGVEWSIVRFDNYYGWEVNPNTGALHSPFSKDSNTRITQKLISEWATRRDAFLAGDYDNIYVPRMYVGQVEGQSGIQMWKDMPDLGVAAQFYTLDINPASPYMGVPGGLAAGDLDESGISTDFFQDEDLRKGINHLIDFPTYLTDAWLNEAEQPTTPVIRGLPYFNPQNPVYSYDLAKATQYFKDAYLGHAEDDGGTPEGALWDVGFTMIVVYNEGNVPRQTLAQMIIDGINAMGNAKFHVSILGIEWGATYIPQLFTGQLTLFVIGWGADFPDPHNFAHPFMHSAGAFSGPQAVGVLSESAHIDAVIEAAVAISDSLYETLTVTNVGAVDLANPVGSTWTDGVDTFEMTGWTDSYQTNVAVDQPSKDGVVSGGDMGLQATATGGYDPSHPTTQPGDFVIMTNTGTNEWKLYHVKTVSGSTTLELEHSRGAYYYDLGMVYYSAPIGMMTHQALVRRWQRDWYQGWYYNPMFFVHDAWKAWKEYLGDTERDGDVDIDDLGNVLYGWPDNPLDPTQDIAWSVATYGVPWDTDIDVDDYVEVDDLGWVLWNY